MSANETIGPERTRLNFANFVAERFGFLNDFGFAVTESSPTIVRYQKGEVELDIYHGRQSYELGFGVEHRAIRYSISDVIRIADSEAAQQYRNFAATTPDGIAEGLSRLATLVKRYAEPVLRGEPKCFAALKKQREAWATEYALDVLAEQLRPKAEAAFRHGDYQEAAELYEKIRPRLSATEVKKMDLARARAGVRG